MDNVFGLRELDDEAETRALKRTLQSYEDQILFLENSSSGENHRMVAYQLADKWHIRSLSDEVSHELLFQFLHYTMTVVECVDQSMPDSGFGEYYSIHPLVYGGEYWLSTVCRQEFDRYKDLNETGLMSVVILPWQDDRSLFELVESVRQGDRVGYFETFLGILLPFTNKDQGEIVARRLKRNFETQVAYCWQIERDFNNLHELTTKVKKLL